MCTTRPIAELNSWLLAEKEQGAPNPNHAVLSSISSEGLPHSRVIAIREITDEGLLFFTQRVTRKVREIENAPVSLVFWLELLQRQVIIEGFATALSGEQNEYYWHTYPQWAQIRFLSYAPTSMQPISHKNELEKKREEMARSFQNKSIPQSPDYCGFKIQPQRMVFYAYRLDELSDVHEYVLGEQGWEKQLLSP